MAYGGNELVEIEGSFADLELAPSCPVEEARLEWEWNKGHNFRMGNLFETGFLSDIVLEVGRQKKQVKAHRLFLQAGSPELYNRINKLSKDKDAVLPFPDVEYDSFALFLKFLYTGVTGSDLENLEFLPLLKIATELQVSTLANICANKAESSLSEENVLPIFQQAMECGHKALIRSSLIFICKHAWKIVESEGFSELRQDVLYEILTQDDLQVKSELQLFQAVLRWANAECIRGGLEPSWDHIRVALTKVIGLIRFPVMDQAEFTLNVALNNILGLEELVKILLYFTVPPAEREKIPPGRFISTPRQYYKQQPGVKVKPTFFEQPPIASSNSTQAPWPKARASAAVIITDEDFDCDIDVDDAYICQPENDNITPPPTEDVSLPKKEKTKKKENTKSRHLFQL